MKPLTGKPISRNKPCPCESARNYKGCCSGRVPWEALRESPLPEFSQHLSLRGKNLAFLAVLADALQIDKPGSISSFAEFKIRITEESVVKVFTSIGMIWPSREDYVRCLSSTELQVTALYTGKYNPDSVIQAIGRLSLYCERILLVDPFFRPEMIQKQFSPLLHPEQYRSNVVRFATLWLKMLPWIDAGIVSFIRPQWDHEPSMRAEIMAIQRKKFDSNPELKELLTEQTRKEVAALGGMDRGMGEYWFLNHSDEFLAKEMLTESEYQDDATKQSLLNFLQRRRAEHPFAVDRTPGQTAEIQQETTGACYELAKRMCRLTGSHLVTDGAVRWKEIELDREEAKIDSQQWSPFAKALRASDLSVLAKVPLEAALRLREEQRLQGMRLFLNKVWRTARVSDEFSDRNIPALSAELHEQIAIAKLEWKKIDSDLLKWCGATGALVIASGTIGFLPAAVAGAATLVDSVLRRKAFEERFPAAFFVNQCK